MSNPIPSNLEVSLQHTIGGIHLDVSFRLTQPWTVLFAPSGTGKSTILRAICGLLRPDSGTVHADVPLLDTAQGISVPPHQRRIPLVAQRAAVFPHMTVGKNIAYAARNQDIAAITRICRIDHLLDKRPAALSGGEQQRVAIARALAASASARLLLLDEAFNGFDLILRDEVMAELQPWLLNLNLPVLHVTHDIGEVFAANAEVLRMESGRIAAQGTASEVLSQEREHLLNHLSL